MMLVTDPWIAGSFMIRQMFSKLALMDQYLKFQAGGGDSSLSK